MRVRIQVRMQLHRWRPTTSGVDSAPDPVLASSPLLALPPHIVFFNPPLSSRKWLPPPPLWPRLKDEGPPMRRYFSLPSCFSSSLSQWRLDWGFSINRGEEWLNGTITTSGHKRFVGLGMKRRRGGGVDGPPSAASHLLRVHSGADGTFSAPSVSSDNKPPWPRSIFMLLFPVYTPNRDVCTVDCLVNKKTITFFYK